jgi:nucleotidyltransferase/DNA polymerase involved in DNA repair
MNMLILSIIFIAVAVLYGAVQGNLVPMNEATAASQELTEQLKTLQLYTSQFEELHKTAEELVHQYLDRNERIRLIGVRVSSLKSGKGQEILS